MKSTKPLNYQNANLIYKLIASSAPLPTVKELGVGASASGCHAAEKVEIRLTLKLEQSWSRCMQRSISNSKTLEYVLTTVQQN